MGEKTGWGAKNHPVNSARERFPKMGGEKTLNEALCNTAPENGRKLSSEKERAPHDGTARNGRPKGPKTNFQGKRQLASKEP